MRVADPPWWSVAGRTIDRTPPAAAPRPPRAAAFALDPVTGSCLGDRNDISSRNSLVSHTIRMPRGAMAPKLTVNHYVATEAGWDGGKVEGSWGQTELALARAGVGRGQDLAIRTSPARGRFRRR